VAAHCNQTFLIFSSCPAPPAADPHRKGVCRGRVPPSAVAAAPHLFLRRFPVQPLPHRHCGPVPGCTRFRPSGVLRGVLRSLLSAFLLPAAVPSPGVSRPPLSLVGLLASEVHRSNAATRPAWLPACALHIAFCLFRSNPPCSWQRCCGRRRKCQMTSRLWRCARWRCR
jgi:hypothetical protein